MRFILAYCLKEEYNLIYQQNIWKETSSVILNACINENAMNKLLRENHEKKEQCFKLFHECMEKLKVKLNNYKK